MHDPQFQVPTEGPQTDPAVVTPKVAAAWGPVRSPRFTLTQAARALRRSPVSFSGRVARSEFWWSVLAITAIAAPLSLMRSVVGMSAAGSLPWVSVTAVGALVSAVTLAMTLGLAARRLHDVDRPGWLQVLVLVPVLGWIAMLVLLCLPATPGPNRYGPMSLPTGRRASAGVITLTAAGLVVTVGLAGVFLVQVAVSAIQAVRAQQVLAASGASSAARQLPAESTVIPPSEAAAAPSTPHGWTPVTTDALTLAVPPGWGWATLGDDGGLRIHGVSLRGQPDLKAGIRHDLETGAEVELFSASSLRGLGVYATTLLVWTGSLDGYPDTPDGLKTMLDEGYDHDGERNVSYHGFSHPIAPAAAERFTIVDDHGDEVRVRFIAVGLKPTSFFAELSIDDERIGDTTAGEAIVRTIRPGALKRPQSSGDMARVRVTARAVLHVESSQAARPSGRPTSR